MPLKLEIEKLRRTLYGARSERKARLLDQLEMQLEDAEADASEDELAAERWSAPSTVVRSFERRRPARQPFPEHLPRERVVITAPQSCPCCGSTKLAKLGEDVTETLEAVPRQWKVIQTVRERFSCRRCETITQPPAPFHVTPAALWVREGVGAVGVDGFIQQGPHPSVPAFRNAPDLVDFARLIAPRNQAQIARIPLQPKKPKRGVSRGPGVRSRQRKQFPHGLLDFCTSRISRPAFF